MSSAERESPLGAATAVAEVQTPPLPPPSPQLQAVVVVPAHNEEQRIGVCLRSLADQRDVAPTSYEVLVVLDACEDASAERAREAAADLPGLRVHLVELAAAHGVGWARRTGMDLACSRLLSLGRSRGLIATTDADTRVAGDWLATQLELVARGAQAIGGSIELDEREAGELPAGVLDERALRASERIDAVLARGAAQQLTEHHHFSGASMALTVAAYAACGGLPPQAALEDEALARELARCDIPIHRSRAVRVRTSARTEGRAPRGLARDLALSSWRARRSYRAEAFPLARLLEAKDSSIALVLPTREVSATIGPIAASAARLRDVGLLDEVLVVDAASRDGTAALAARSGVRVIQESELSSEYGPARGKGDAMWRALREVSSDIVVFADTDSLDFREQFITGLLGPLLCEPGVWLVKGSFRRPFRLLDAVVEGDGGRVTELVARPLLNLYAPELAGFDQPLAGEFAARRTLLDEIPFSAGYGVEIAMLIDAWRIVGLDALAQVDLGTRQNRHQPLRELSAMAYAVIVAAQSRLHPGESSDTGRWGSIMLPPRERGGPMEPRGVAIEERPPIGQRSRDDTALLAAHLAAHSATGAHGGD